jgi:rubrerythrin
MSSKNTMDRLRGTRRKEREQTKFYRALAARAEGVGDAETAERLVDLLADEQHHLSRLTARILELGGAPEDEDQEELEDASLKGWEERARSRELEEIEWYESLLEVETDEATRVVFTEILESERYHAEHLAGKWMSA